MNIKSQQYIVQFDPGYVRTTDEGNYVLIREGEEITMTPDQYDEVHPLSTTDEFFALIDMALIRIDREEMPMAQVVDVLLDARTLFVQTLEIHKEMARIFMNRK